MVLIALVGNRADYDLESRLDAASKLFASSDGTIVVISPELRDETLVLYFTITS